MASRFSTVVSLPDSVALLLHRFIERPLALFFQQVIEDFCLRVRLLLQDRLVGFQDAFHGG